MALGAQGAAPGNTYIETAAIGVKEDLSDVIYRIDPDECPLLLVPFPEYRRTKYLLNGSSRL
jgi:hypothetical protein